MKTSLLGCCGLALALQLGCTATPAAPTVASTGLTLPTPGPDGPPREVQVILDAPHLKLVAITLRQGTPLPQHSASVPVIIQATAGSGTAVVDDQRLPLDTTHAVSLAPNAPHAVEPDPDTDMTLLVFHLRGTQTD